MQNIALTSNLNFFYYIVLFAIYCFIGWAVEVIYRSVSQRKFVNAGFLFGPFILIYGFGAFLVIVLQHLFQDWPIAARFIAFGLAVTAMEYLVGLLSEKIFKLTLWDYSGNRFNLHGYVCLQFSIIWTLLAVGFVTWIHPIVLQWVAGFNEVFVRIAAIVFLVYCWIDYTFSVMSLAAFRRGVAYIYDQYFNLSNAEIENNLKSFQRLRDAFPDLNNYINENINRKIRSRINSLLKPIQEKIFLEMADRKPFEKEYYEIVQDILQHEEFLKLKDFFHHNSSIYAHVNDVAYFSYRISKYFKLDYRSTARGALLHDFFLYDWRNHDVPDLPREKFHGLAHPAIAVANAKKYFSVNEIEEDIIKRHMWPLTLVPPKYKESYIVSFADKYLSSREFINEYKKRLNERQEKKTENKKNKIKIEE
ncbi:MAG: hypothetical protein EG826_03050 [Deltaproteobacteria bacterium]|nr:hypothetical protein [Deltaproteobacteria bacterium]